MVKLYAPAACFTFFGIFQEYSMEYSIFQNFPYFTCFTIFLEFHIPKISIFFLFYSFFGIFHFKYFNEKYILPWLYVFGIFRNIPYSKKVENLYVLRFSWNIPYFYIFIFHGIFHGIFRGIFHGIFHIPKFWNKNMFYGGVKFNQVNSFDLLKLLCESLQQEAERLSHEISRPGTWCKLSSVSWH